MRQSSTVPLSAEQVNAILARAAGDIDVCENPPGRNTSAVLAVFGFAAHRSVDQAADAEAMLDALESDR
jgi:hypothetical protein